MINKFASKFNKKQLLISLSMVLALTSCAVLFGVKSYAFKPDKKDFGHTCITRSAIEKVPSTPDCGGVPKDAAESFKVKLSDEAGGQDIYFTAEAQKDVVQGVQSNDWVVEGALSNLPFDLFPIANDVADNPYQGDSYNSNAHCDDDQIPGCRAMILQRRLFAMDQLVLAYAAHKALNDDEAYKRARIARMWIGKSLHTIQDFYAHSNYSEIRGIRASESNTDYYYALTGGTAVSRNQDNSNNFCKPRFASLLATTTGVFTWEDNPGNWELDNLGLSVYSTGYFTLNKSGFGLDADAPNAAVAGGVASSRCDHGFDGLQPGTPLFARISGINKDSPRVVLKPGPGIPRPDGSGSSDDFHTDAATYATRHTRAFLKSVETEVIALTTSPTRIPRDSSTETNTRGKNWGQIQITHTVKHPAFQRNRPCSTPRLATNTTTTTTATTRPSKTTACPNQLSRPFTLSAAVAGWEWCATTPAPSRPRCVRAWRTGAARSAA